METLSSRTVIYWLGYFGLAMLIIMLNILPLQTVPPEFFSMNAVSLESNATTMFGLVFAVLKSFLADFVLSLVSTPNVLLAFTCAWVLRKPEYVPVMLIGAVFLLADFLLQRPPGLYAAVVIIGTEFLRRRVMELRGAPFLVEYLTVAGVIFAIAIMYRIFSSVAVITPPDFWLLFLQAVSTIVIYPLVVFVTQAVFGIRSVMPGQLDEGRGRL
ncbi:hypothetical protein [Parasulfitobacter algicola]|uniref:Rod shape-determining protein MreD n=1 Tax=Parasulfitobacter algicola TaxID=2614809 RepID=A0ABX2ITE0_9RHOB|nr:hypothetical protein [Sulfitobacter algicola]NSX54082.1 hypothetical protein [Sulfitobacter algicola]